MKKISLLATSVAIALTGCGGGGDDSAPTSSSGSNVITGFDGYFKNAVVFIDNNDNGSWDLTEDTFLGLTNSKGQLNVGATKPAGTLAIQTVTPGGTAQSNLLNIDSEKYAGTYTVDMDLPGQPMEHEVVFRAPNSSDVISPITDLVTIELKKGQTLEQAEAAVKTALTGSEDGDVDLYSDFVKESKSGDTKAAVLHKTAQILTVTKAAAPDSSSYEDIAVAIAKQADEAAESIADNADLLNDASFKPEVPVDAGQPKPIPDEVITSPDYKTTVNPDVAEEIQKTVDGLSLKLGTENGMVYHKIDITELFEDKNVTETDLATLLESITLNSEQLEKEYGLVVYLGSNEGPELTLSIAQPKDKEIIKAGKASLKLTLPANNDLKVNGIDLEFPFIISANEDITPPTYDKTAAAYIQEELDTWVFGRNVQSPVYKLDYSSLFNQGDKITVTSNAILNGFVIGQPAADNTVTVSAVPKRSAAEDSTAYTVKLIATSEQGLTTTVTFALPKVIQSTPETCDLLDNCADFPVEELENQDDCENNGGYWYNNSCHTDPKPVDPVEPVDPPVASNLKFTPQHFAKGGIWQMGSFDYGDAEVAFASLRVNNGQNEFCFATNDDDLNNTLSRNSWKTSLINLDENKEIFGDDIVTDADCSTAIISDDGRLILEDEENSTLTLVYEHLKGTDYQLIIKANDGELFWLDSSNVPFDQFDYPKATGGYTEYFLIDDRMDYNVLDPLVDGFTYTQTSTSAGEVILKEGTFTASSLTYPEEGTWEGKWRVEEPIQGEGQYLITPDINDDQNPPVEISRLFYNYRDFGDIQIGIGDSDKGYGNNLEDNGFFYISSANKEVVDGIHKAWTGYVPPMDPTAILGKPLYFIESSEDSTNSLNRCETFQLSGDEHKGTVYFGAETNDDLTKQCAPVSGSSSATYLIEDNIITINEEGYEPMKFTLLNVAGQEGANRFLIHTSEMNDQDEVHYSVFEAFENKSDAEARIATSSTASWDELSQPITLWINGEFVEVNVTPQMTNQRDDGQEIADADLFFDRINGNIGCEDLKVAFKEAEFAGLNHWECWRGEDGGFETATLDFDFYSPITNGTFSINLESNNPYKIPSFKRNIVFNGDSSYE